MNIRDWTLDLERARIARILSERGNRDNASPAHWYRACQIACDRIAAGPSELDLCDTCNGRSNAYCSIHGIAASNDRQNAFFRDYDKRVSK